MKKKRSTEHALRMAGSYAADALRLAESVDGATSQKRFERLCHEVLGLVSAALRLIREALEPEATDA